MRIVFVWKNYVVVLPQRRWHNNESGHAEQVFHSSLKSNNSLEYDKLCLMGFAKSATNVLLVKQTDEQLRNEASL